MRHSEDPAVVERVLTLVETVGVDEIAELWSDAEPDSLPGVPVSYTHLHVIAGVKNDQTQHIARMVNVHNRQREGAWFTGTSGTRRRLHSATRSTGICLSLIHI